ncbi:hypothetical protein [Burkholderia ubonensis]|uniref:hypothetical protein n=1 Tax=Burkholderia ubonensis TaxID=101571 RepID=UPI0007539BDA|nr:hypothetical protein [Burkholderia ubonensis]KVP40001.1 hypothetical protein WJ87_07405 [Burkholderia ubonensis]
MSLVSPNNPQLKQVFDVVEALHQTLQHHDLLEAHPDLAFDFVGLQEALAVLADDGLTIRYWRARKAEILQKYPDLKAKQAGQTPQEVPCAARRSYIRQEAKGD